jgi:hypothetical protein
MSLHNGRFGEKLHCPQNQCQKALLPNEIKQIIQDVHLYQRYERLTLQNALELMNDIIWCPRSVKNRNKCNSSRTSSEQDTNLRY